MNYYVWKRRPLPKLSDVHPSRKKISSSHPFLNSLQFPLSGILCFLVIVASLNPLNLSFFSFFTFRLTIFCFNLTPVFLPPPVLHSSSFTPRFRVLGFLVSWLRAVQCLLIVPVFCKFSTPLCAFPFCSPVRRHEHLPPFLLRFFTASRWRCSPSIQETHLSSAHSLFKLLSASVGFFSSSACFESSCVGY